MGQVLELERRATAGRISAGKPRPAVERQEKPTSEYPGSSLNTWLVAHLACDLMQQVFGVEPWQLKAWRGERKTAFYRQIAIHLVHVVAGRKHGEAAAAFGRNRSTAAHHFETVEDLRDVPAYDSFLDELEARFRMMLEYAARPSVKQAWREALAALEVGSDLGYLEGNAQDAAQYVVATFKGGG